MPQPERTDPEPAEPTAAQPAREAPEDRPAPPAAPGVLTALVCERCGNVDLVRVKGCWYCEKCHYKFDCYGF